MTGCSALAAATGALLLAPAALATNGMCLEGYGPIASGLGGASMAYDVGTGAMMNNPATLALLGTGNHVEIAVGVLGPAVTTSIPAFELSEESAATLFAMPAMGYVRGGEKWSFGLGMFAQGGMGTDYGSESFLSMTSLGEATGLPNMSSVSVGRLLAPVTYRVNDQLVLGGSADLVYAGLDMQMLIDGAQMNDMLPITMNPFATQSMGEVMPDDVFAGMLGSLGMLHYAHLDMNKEGDYASEATAFGFAGKLGLVYDLNDALTIGATYHLKSALADLEGRATMSIKADSTGGAAMPMTGDVAIHDFQWPAIAGFGVAYHPQDNLLVALDVKHVAWSGAMERFELTFTADEEFGSPSMDMSLKQEWEDQIVVAGGVEFGVSDAFVLRSGFNIGQNPVPDANLNPLFPATVENHLSLGLGWAPIESGQVNLAYSRGFEADNTNSNPLVGTTSTHCQDNFQISYLHSF